MPALEVLQAHMKPSSPSSGTQAKRKSCCRDTSTNRARELSAEALALQERVDALGIAIAERTEENNCLQEQVL